MFDGRHFFDDNEVPIVFSWETDMKTVERIWKVWLQKLYKKDNKSFLKKTFKKLYKNFIKSFDWVLCTPKMWLDEYFLNSWYRNCERSIKIIRRMYMFYLTKRSCNLW